jgi:broad specificity phosphatase PhoE
MPTLLLVRHGQASFGADDYDRLSTLGHEQAELLGRRLHTSIGSVDRVLSGRHRRHLETVRAVGRQLPGAAAGPEQLAGLDEYQMGPAAFADGPDELTFDPGSSSARDRVGAALDLAVKRWLGRPGSPGETYPEFGERVRLALEEAASHPGTTLVSTSGGVISAIAAQLLGLDPYRWAALNRTVVNASLTKVLAGRRGLTLLTFNDHAHLEHDRRLITYR